MSERPVLKSTAALISLILFILSWQLTAAIFIGRWLFGPAWLSPHRAWVVVAITVALSLYHVLVGRPLLRRYYPQTGDLSKHSLTLSQSITVVVMMIGAGVIGTWLFS